MSDRYQVGAIIAEVVGGNVKLTTAHQGGLLRGNDVVIERADIEDVRAVLEMAQKKVTAETVQMKKTLDPIEWTAVVNESLGVDDDEATMVAYLQLCVRTRDWHAVSDAANDLRVMEARKR